MFLLNVFLSGEKKMRWINFITEPYAHLSLWTKRSVLYWNGIEGQGSDTGILSNTGKWPLRGETNKSWGYSHLTS